MPDRKYTDADVRHDPNLKPLALAYISVYKGEFEPLVKLTEIVRTHGVHELTVSQARMVLNCMLHDANVINLPTPSRTPFDAAEHYPSAYAVARKIRKQPLPSVIPMKSKWKDPFFFSTWPTAKLLHVVRNTDRYRSQWTPVRYFREQHELRFDIWIECSTHVPRGIGAFASHAQANHKVMHEGKKLCKQCMDYSGKWEINEDGLIIRKEEEV